MPRSQGLTFKRVQRPRFHDKPLVQIVYLPEKGKPVALCVLKEAKADAARPMARSTAWPWFHGDEGNSATR
jgi:hypothetical protein